MKLSTATSVLYQYEIHDAIRLIKQVGFEGVDLWGGRPHIYRKDHSNKELRELQKFIVNQKLAVSSLMPAFYRYPHSLSNPNPIVRNDSINYMQECVESAAILGSQIVLVVPDLSLKNQSREDTLFRFIESLDIVARFTSKFPKIKLGIEILYADETNFLNSADDALNIINQLDYSNIGVVLDTGTLNLSREPIRKIFSNFGEKILQIHINDNNGNYRQQNLIPGEGTYDFPYLIRCLKDVGYAGFLSVELSKEYANEAETALAMTVERLNNWINNPQTNHTEKEV